MDTLTTGGLQRHVYAYYATHGRHNLAWRIATADGTYDAYQIMVSEYMLQQTQVARVEPAYQRFVRQFPNVMTLAAASRTDVLAAWNGLGYNRRAMFIHEAAQRIVNYHGGKVPDTMEALVALPGIGTNTAAAILVYAHNLPLVFLETNIRSVFIYHFFPDASLVTDEDLLPLVQACLDDVHPREWYWALMDYGSYVKTENRNPSRSSSAYHPQSKFKGSVREVRGQVIRRLLQAQPATYESLRQSIHDARLAQILQKMTQESLIQQGIEGYHL